MTSKQTQQLWYAVRVKSNRERVTAASLRGKEFEVFLPVYSSATMKNGKERLAAHPLFPGYLFSRFDPLKRLPILTIPGVVGVVGLGKMPQPVESQEMDRLFAITESRLPVAPYPYPPVGDRIRLQGGPLRGLEGIILCQKGQDKLVVSVSLLQRSVAVNVERDWLTANVQSCFAA
jgi:transcription antitermination factor NusG